MGVHRLPSRERIRKKPEFSRTMSEGRRLDAERVRAYWCTDSGDAPDRVNRVGFAAGRRLGNAVLRNRLKRRLREAYRKHKDELPWKNMRIVLQARSRAIESASREIEADVVELLQRIRAAAASSSESSPPSSELTDT